MIIMQWIIWGFILVGWTTGLILLVRETSESKFRGKSKRY